MSSAATATTYAAHQSVAAKATIAATGSTVVGKGVAMYAAGQSLAASVDVAAPAAAVVGIPVGIGLLFYGGYRLIRYLGED